MLLSNILLATIASAGVVHLPLKARDVSGVAHSTQTMGHTFYETDLEVGTPPQKVRCIFDTGSGHVWFPGSNTTNCLDHKFCRSSYDVSKSSTWKFQSHGSGWGSQGNNGKDTLSYAGETIKDFDIFVATERFAFDICIFGQSNDDDPSKNYVQALAHAGKISRAVYSLNAEKPINYGESTYGVVNNVYYGGFDKAKYQGPLTTIDCDHHGGYAMPLGGFSIQGEKVQLARDHQVVLDTGGMGSVYPNSTLKAVSQKFGGGGVFEDGAWKIGCDSKPEITYEWGYTKIDVDMIPNIIKSPKGGCHIGGLTATSDNTEILLTGPPLISRSLVIYDNVRDTITLAKAKYSDESDVVEITGDIPGAVLYKDFLAGKPL